MSGATTRTGTSDATVRRLKARARHAARRLEIMVWIRESTELTSEQKVMLYDLASHENFEEFARRDHVRARLGLSDYKYRRIPAQLEERGLITVTRGRRGRDATKYKLNVDALREHHGWYHWTEPPVVDVNKTPMAKRQSTVVGRHQATNVGGDQQKQNTKRNIEKINKNGKNDPPRR